MVNDPIYEHDAETHRIYKDLKGLDFDPSLNQWIGPITENMVSDTGKMVTFGPAPIGLPSIIEAVVLLVGIKRLSESPEGLKVLRDLGMEYLRTIGKVISTLSQSSSAHVISCAMNQYVACTIYQRLGLMSPHDAAETRAWLDHQTGEAMLTERAGQSLGALTTLVNSTTTGGGETGSYAAGLGAFAKILGKE